MKRSFVSLTALLRLATIYAGAVVSQPLPADISEALDRQRLIKDFDNDYQKKNTAIRLNKTFKPNSNQKFFSVESELPLPTQQNASPGTSAKTSSKDSSLSDISNNVNHALNGTAAHEETYEATGSDEPEERIVAEVNSSNPRTPQPAAPATQDNQDKTQPILIRFNNVSIIEYLRFISGISRKNFIFDENDLQFNITMISEEPTSIEDFMTALMQELRIHDLTLLEQGNNVVIHKNFKVNNVSTIITDTSEDKKTQYELVTQIFRLNTIDAEKVALIIRPLISERAIVETIKDTNHLILTDLVSNVTEISKLIRTLDSPKGGLVVGQYVVRTSTIDTILPIVQQLMDPIAADKSIQYVPYSPSNSIFIVSTPFLVEKALSFMQHLDQNQKSTQLIDLKDLKYDQKGSESKQLLPPPGLFINGKTFEPGQPEKANESSHETKNEILPEATHGWKADKKGNWTFKVLTGQGQTTDQAKPPKGKWTIDPKGNWLFLPGAAIAPDEEQNQPNGHWEIDPAGNWEFDLDPGEAIGIHVISRSAPEKEELLPGSKPRGQFFLHKVHYRRGEELQRSLQSMADSLRGTENVDIDLVNALISAQWLESSNSIVFSGTPAALKKIAMLIDEIDVPLRQVFIEMLILEASLVDTLNYTVKWANRFGGGNWAGADGFDSTFPSPLSAAINTTGVNNLGQPIQINPATGLPVLGQVFTPNPTPFNGTPGFDMGIIGQRIFNKLTGIEFESIGAFINCLRGITTSNIVLNPKIISEDGIPAEIFVGENIAYQTQSIVNDQGVILTSNFEYRDVGTRLKVTPYLGGSDIIALEIENEITNVITNAQAGLPANSNVGPNTSKSSTVTRVHVPSGYFVVISGMLRDETRRTDAHAPCLGGIPIIGAAFKDKSYADQKRNLMIFIQPKIIDTDEEMQNLTKHQQDLLKVKNRRKKDMLYETEEFLDFLNMKKYEHERTSLEFEDDEEPQ